MINNFRVTGSFNATVECACAGPEHDAACDVEERKYEAADEAVKSGVEVDYEEFAERREF